MALAEALLDLQGLTRTLRRECPWDRKQTARTIVPHTLEEGLVQALHLSQRWWSEPRPSGSSS